MKRASILVLSLVVALCMAIPLAGCASTSYTPELKEQTVSDSALNTSGTLRVGVNASNPPYAGQQSGSIIGINVDVAAALADELGLKLEVVDVGTATDTAFARESVDIVMGVEEENSAYTLSEPYMSSAIALFSLTEDAQAPTSSGSFTIAAQSSSMSAWEVSDHYGESCLENVSDPTAAFEALNSGTVNYVAADSTIGEYVIHQSGYEAYPIALFEEVTPCSIAVAADNTELQEAVDTALASLVDGGVVTIIQNRWLGEQIDLSSLSVIAASTSSEESNDSSEETADTSSVDTDTSEGSSADTDTSEGDTTSSTTTDTSDTTDASDSSATVE